MKQPQFGQVMIFWKTWVKFCESKTQLFCFLVGKLQKATFLRSIFIKACTLSCRRCRKVKCDHFFKIKKHVVFFWKSEGQLFFFLCQSYKTMLLCVERTDLFLWKLLSGRNGGSEGSSLKISTKSENTWCWWKSAKVKVNTFGFWCKSYKPMVLRVERIDLFLC